MPCQTEAGRLGFRAACLIIVPNTVSGHGFSTRRICTALSGYARMTLQMPHVNRFRTQSTS